MMIQPQKTMTMIVKMKTFSLNEDFLAKIGSNVSLAFC